ncbi:hypothetical protein M8818_003236 [Zalaria obscura]|uniref:Uncharacterized protein n=1 Tax=Zalaria obscura TaxID=2024903 RepID=A0ACC3SFE8_9PEZI
MASPLAPDPYLALGIPSTATSTQIKQTYRKLALKYHPDKVTNEAEKAAAADKFHEIQQAYEILGDDDRRSRYDAQVKLAELRRDVLERQGRGGAAADGVSVTGMGNGVRVDVKTAGYDIPTSPGAAAFKARGPERYEERRPSRATYDSDGYFDEYAAGASRASARKYDEYERGPKRTSPRDDRERTRAWERSSKENERRARGDRRKMSEREVKRDRGTKYAVVEEDSEDEYDGPRRSDRLKEEAAARRQREIDELSRRKGMEARIRDGVYVGTGEDRTRKMSIQESEAMEYMQRAAGRPLTSRTSSARYEDEYIRSPIQERPTVVRRSSQRPPTSSSPRRSSAREPRERKLSVPEIVDFPSSPSTATDKRRPPMVPHSASSPAGMKVPGAVKRESPLKAQTYDDYDDRGRFEAPPSIRRSETMPVDGSTSLGAERSSGRRRGDRDRRDRDRDRDRARVDSKLRPTDITDGYPTPSTTPVEGGLPTGAYTQPAYSTASQSQSQSQLPGSYATKTSYRYNPAAQTLQDMVDEDVELSNGRRTVLREPSDSRGERGGRRDRDRDRDGRGGGSVRDRDRDRERESSRLDKPSRRPTLDTASRTTSTSYIYPSASESPVSYLARPSPLNRSSTERPGPLFGEKVPSLSPVRDRDQTTTSRPSNYNYPYPERERDGSGSGGGSGGGGYRFHPGVEEVRFAKPITREEVRVGSGYRTRSGAGGGGGGGGEARPGLRRGVTVGY